MKPKILVISNDCFSKSSSNGRTMANFFSQWPKDKIAQFYIHDYNLSKETCENYYHITDQDVLKSMFFIKPRKVNNKTSSSNSNSSSGVNRNALTMLLRNFAWNLGIWKKYGFSKWVLSYNPDIVLLQAGDSPFMYNLAVSICKKTQAKLVIYNSEGYYFKNYDYFKSKGIAHLIYPIFLHVLKNSLEKAYAISCHNIYSCGQLKEAYDEKFKQNASVIYTSSSMKMIFKDNFTCKKPIISYCGNLGVNRHKSLIEIGTIIHDFDNDMCLDVYGRLPNSIIKDELENCKGINYKGLVSYDEVQSIMYNSDINIHVESFEKFYIEDLKYGFSTKIADSLSCGTCFLVYAPKDIACVTYLQNNNAAHVVTNKNDLKSILYRIINDVEYRQKYLLNASKVAKQNHDQDRNIQKFQSILLKVYK